jgi:hypothetical protein
MNKMSVAELPRSYGPILFCTDQTERLAQIVLTGGYLGSIQRSWTGNTTTAFALLQAASPNPRRTWGDVTSELIAISQLQNDWDGMGAASLSREVVQNCFGLMRNCRNEGMLEPNLVRPAPDGTVVFEWVYGDSRLEMEVSADSIDLINFDSSGGLDYQQVPIG